jgi:hypothetical protein
VVGAIEALGQGKARARLADAVVEGPADLLGGPAIDVEIHGKAGPTS